jgi:hypothetical protein
MCFDSGTVPLAADKSNGSLLAADLVNRQVVVAAEVEAMAKKPVTEWPKRQKLQDDYPHTLVRRVSDTKQYVGPTLVDFAGLRLLRSPSAFGW